MPPHQNHKDKTVKLTKETLERIIKEELNHLMLEEKVEQAIADAAKNPEEVAKDAQKIASSKEGQNMIDRLDDDARIAKALEDVLASPELQGTMQEVYPGTPREMGGLKDYEQYMRDKEARDADTSGELVSGGAFVGAMAAPMVVPAILKSAAGKALIAALAPAVGSTAAGIGLGLAATGGALAVPMAIAMVLAKLDAKNAAK